MGEIRVMTSGGRFLSLPVEETDDGSLLAERIAKAVNNMHVSGKDRLVQLGAGKYVLASLVRQVWFVNDAREQAVPV